MRVLPKIKHKKVDTYHFSAMTDIDLTKCIACKEDPNIMATHELGHQVAFCILCWEALHTTWRASFVDTVRIQYDQYNQF